MDRVEFMEGPETLRSKYGEPIYGKINAGRKGQFTGYVQWDMQERFMTDILDGKDRNGDRKIPFRSIAKIQKGRNGSDVVFKIRKNLFI